VSGNDGGRAALAGFLYQLAASAALVAHASVPQQGNVGDDLNLLVALARSGNVVGEAFNQDVVVRFLGLTNSDECALVQVKFSQNPSAKLDLSDMAEIVEGLVEKV
jgi:hypothetical protein